MRTATGRLFYQTPLLLHYLFIIYLLFRMDAGITDGNDIVLEQVLYLLMFSVAAVYSFNYKLNLVISIIPLMYLVIFVVKVSFRLEEVKIGANLWSGYVVFLLIPLLIMHLDRNIRKHRVLVFATIVIFACFLTIVTARVATISLIMFYIFLLLLPNLNRNLRSITFLVTVISLLYFVKVYTDIQNIGFVKELDQLSLTYLNKTLFSGRQFIWMDILRLIEQKPIWGYCSNCASELFQATEMRRNLSSHNTFLEIVLRGGVVGLVIFVSIFFSAWKTLFKYRKDHLVSVSAAFLLASFIFMSSAELWFSNIVMCNTIAWMIFGLGYGRAYSLSLLKHNNNFTSEVNYLAVCKKVT
ncbi:MAG: O-antigen ligase family protein [Gammaproteobacteria bacterium]|nr:O-antigen ligase family protein [Gammaproteobacteria bacterium]